MPNWPKGEIYFHTVIQANARIIPDALALAFNGRDYTWAEMHGAVEGLRRGLARAGVVHGTRVAVFDRNSDHFLLLGYALAAMGAVIVPINIHLRSAEAAYILGNCRPSFLVTNDEFRQIVDQATADLENRPRIISRGEIRDGDIGWEDVADGPSDIEISSPKSWNDTHLVLYTSGTTGKPKGVLLSHRRTVLDALAASAAFGIRRGDRFFCYLPQFHTASWDWIKMFLLQQGAVVLAERFDAANAIDLMQRYRCTAMLGFSVVLKKLIEAPEWQGADMSSMRFLGYGAYDPSNLLEETIRQFRERGATEMEFALPYGLTEAGPFVLIGRPEDVRGRASMLGTPVPGVDVALLDDDDREVPRGEVGEICVRSAAVMSGYLDNPEATAEAFRNGWLHTGDMARQDADSFYHMVDRKKDMIRTAGENVFAKEVEQVLVTHPAIAECAVVGMPDDVYGEKVVAAVVSRNGETDATGIQNFVRERIAGFKTPKVVIFLDQLPRNALGKIVKPELREVIRSANIQ
ncbi:MAG: AMP-binding protein [Rhizobium sp.]|nr:AMP-binding protein [Rhizobium sp.]